MPKQLLIALLLFGFATTGFSVGLTPFFVNNTSANGTVDITPAVPTGLQLNDIMIMVVESANQAITAPAGWTEIDSQANMATGTAGAAGSVRMAVFWKRATASESAPTITDTGDHTIATIQAFRGCVKTGNPWDVETVGVQATTNTALSWTSAGMSYGTNGGSITTTVNNCLILGIIGHAVDTASAQLSAEAITTATSVAETAQDNSTASGVGGGVGVSSGILATAGNVVNTSTNTFTATSATTSTYAMMVIALKPDTTVPYVASVNTGSALAAATVSFTCAANDILLLAVQTSNEAITAPSGYTEIDTQANMATGTAVNAGSLRLGMFWKRATGSETSVVVADSGDHQIAAVYVISGATTTGNPWDAESGGVQATTNTAASWQSAGFAYSGSVSTVASTGSNRLVLAIGAQAIDNASQQWNAQAFSNTNVYGFIEESDVSTTLGTGGGIAAVSSRLGSAGTIVDSTTNNFSATLAATSKYALFIIAIPPAVAGPTTAQKAGFFLLFP